MASKPRFYVERGGKRYEIHLSRLCTNGCAFIKYGTYGPCENACHLPRWFKSSFRWWREVFLVLIDDEKKGAKDGNE